MHRVLNLQSIGNNKDKISVHKTAIQTIRDSYTNYIHKGQINDGENDEGLPTLGVNIDFNDAAQCNAFHDELQVYIQNNVSDFSFAKTRIHDCNHAADNNAPCKLGDVKKIV